jgi:hypothetical protein
MFETLYAEPARLKQFLEAMTGISRGANCHRAAVPGAITISPISERRRAIWLSRLQSNPHLQGTVDLPVSNQLR